MKHGPDTPTKTVEGAACFLDNSRPRPSRSVMDPKGAYPSWVAVRDHPGSHWSAAFVGVMPAVAGIGTL